MIINKIYTGIIIIFFCISHALALNTNNKQIIQITSSYQLINTPKNTITFLDNVVATYDSFKIKSDKMSIMFNKTINNKDVIECYGSPIKFSQNNYINKNGIKGNALKVRYEQDNNKICLIGNACITIGTICIHSDYINFFTKEKHIEAYCNTGKYILTTIEQK